MIALTADVIPFRIETPDEDLADLRQRLARTRWPEPATAGGWTQGVPLAYLQELCGYWEWRADLATRDIDRWWCWTVVRFGRRLLAGRRESCRHHPHQWF